MSDSKDNVPLPDPDKLQQSVTVAVEKFNERRGFYIALGIGLLALVSVAIVIANRVAAEEDSGFTPLWNRARNAQSKLVLDLSAQEELAELEAYLGEIRGTSQEGLGLWFLGLYHYAEAWTSEKATFADRQPALEKARDFLEELDGGERFDNLLLAKSDWFADGAQDPIRGLLTQVKADLEWSRDHDYVEPQPDPDLVAILRTAEGDIHLRFFRELAPQHTSSFLKHAKLGVYNGTAFHFVAGGNQEPLAVLGGDPYTFFYNDPLKKKHVLRWGTGTLGFDLPPEAARYKVDHRRGIVTSQRAERADWDNAVQFRILTDTDRTLDRIHTPFAKVVEGMDVIDRIARKKTASEHETFQNDLAFSSRTTRDLLVEPVLVHKVIVYEKGAASGHSFALGEGEEKLSTVAGTKAQPLPEAEIHAGRLLRSIEAEGEPRRGLDVPFPEDAGEKPDPKGDRVTTSG